MKTFSLTGRLTHDPELRDVQVGDETKVLTELRIASRTNRPGKKTDYFTVTAWGNRARTIVEHLGKGRLVRIDGHSEHREVDTDDGKRHYYHDIVDKTEFLDFPEDEETPAGAEAGDPEPAAASEEEAAAQAA